MEALIPMIVISVKLLVILFVSGIVANALIVLYQKITGKEID